MKNMELPMFKITIQNDRETRKRLETIRVKLGDSQANGLWNKISRFLKNIVARIFGGQSIYGVERWPRISPTLYGQIRYSSDGSRVGRYSSSSRPMIASGAYFKSFKQIVNEQKTMKFGSEHDKAHLLENAGWNRKSGYRQRRPMPNPQNPLFVQDINRVADAHIATIIREVS
jgi:hypothetical protein